MPWNQIAAPLANSYITPVVKTTQTYTLALADAGKFLEFSYAGAVTVTIPTNAAVAFPVGTVIELMLTGTGGTLAWTTTGLTFNFAGTGATVPWSPVKIIKRATNTWALVTDMADPNAIPNHLTAAGHVPTGGTVGQVLSKTSSTNFATTWIDSVSGRNKIINGDFSVNQRGYTSAVMVGTGVYTYTLDRWGGRGYGGGGGSVTVSAQTPALAELPESAGRFLRIVSAGQAATGDLAQVKQRIEGVRTLSGKTATVSFWARAASGTPKVAVEFEQYFGSGGSPSATVTKYAGQVTLSTTWTRCTITTVIPSIVGKTIGTAGGDWLCLTLWTSAGSTFNANTGSMGLQAATIDFWGVQLEEGTVATPYEQKTYAAELRDCLRYYEYRSIGTNSGNEIIGLVYAANQVAAGYVRWTVPMRRAPTVTMSNAGVARWIAPGSTNATDKTANPANVSNTGASINMTPIQATPAAGWMDNFDIYADAEL